MTYRKKLLVYFIFFFLPVQVHSQNIDTLISVGSYRLHFNVLQGKGVPIIFESGAGNDGSIWKDLLNPLHDSIGATLITYDREGFGKSDLDSTNLNITTEVKGLEIALKKLGFTGQYFFVAHSLGGNYAMTFISRNSNKVKGAVFIDIVSPCFMTEQKAKSIKQIFIDSIDYIKKESIGFYYIIQNYENTSKVMRTVSKTIKTPLTIICSDIPPFQGSDSVKWKKCLKIFADESSNRRFILATKCGHYVFQDNPKLVIYEIVRQYRKVAAL